MNTRKPAQKAKARHLCFALLLLYFPVVWCGVPGPCRYSLTKSHLVNLNRLMDNQLENGCPITYVFTERQSLSEVCYVKAAFPQILELLNTHFRFARKSDNGRYVKALKKVMYDLYSQNCIPEINEEVEDNPVKFVRMHSTSPREALRKALGLMEMYMTLITRSIEPIDWNCEEEYAEDYSEFTTAVSIPMTAEPESQCACPSVGPVAPNDSLMSHIKWNNPSQATLSPPTSAMPPKPPYPHLRTNNADPEVFFRSPSSKGPPSPREQQRTVPNGSSLGGSREEEIHWDSRPNPPTETESKSAIHSRVADRPSAQNPSRYSPSNLVLQGTTGSKDNNFYFPGTERITEASTVRSAGRETDGSPPSSFTVPRTKGDSHVPFLYKVVGITPSSDSESSAYLLAKRSLDARTNEIRQNGLSTEIPQQQTRETHPGTEVYSHDGDLAIRRATTEASPHLKMTEPERPLTATEVLDPVIKTESKHALTSYEEVFPDNLSKRTNVDDAPISEKHIEDSEIEFPKGDTGHSRISYQTAFIIAAVCIGLLLISIQLCLNERKKLQALLHSDSIIENQRAFSSTENVELQYIAKDLGLISSCQ